MMYNNYIEKNDCGRHLKDAELGFIHCIDCCYMITGLEKNYNLNLPFGQASLKFHLPGQDFINCYLSLVHEQLVHILAHRASEWRKSLVRHKNLLAGCRTGLFSSPELHEPTSLAS